MIILGLGSNQGDRLANIKTAIAEIAKISQSLICASIYSSAALLPENAPEGWDIGFLNTAIRIECKLSPKELLIKIKEIEQNIGRINRGHWGPREIDIDIIAYDDLIISDENLNIPHKEMTKRDFVMIPFAEIAPDWLHPIIGKTALELANNIESSLSIFLD
ncbi:MAG: 2-amino-4-hydroxy-6-hydroxymethyldihydropteridine diphosphokinase [Pseudomonadota bacterium]